MSFWLGLLDTTTPLNSPDCSFFSTRRSYRRCCVHLKKTRVITFKEPFWVVYDGLHDFLPVEGLDSFGVLDVDRVEPLFDVVQHRHGYRRAHHHFLVVVFENEHHVEVLELEVDTLEMHQLDVVQCHAEGGLKYKTSCSFVI